MTRKHWWFAALAAAALLIGVIAIPAFAATNGTPAQPGTRPATPGYGFGRGGMMGAGRGMMGLGIGPLNDEVAAFLKLSPEELQAARQSGQSLADIAAKQGVSREDLVAAMLKVHQDAVAARVKDGTLTQAQADQMLSFMKTQIEQMVDVKTAGPAAGFGCGPGSAAGNGTGAGFGPGRGMMGGRWGQNQNRAPASNVTNS